MSRVRDDKWIDRLTGRRWPVRSDAARRRTEQRMKPLHARTHRAARLVRGRRDAERILASLAAHLRSVERRGDDGLRCWDCAHIPLHPWETVPDDYDYPAHL